MEPDRFEYGLALDPVGLAFLDETGKTFANVEEHFVAGCRPSEWDVALADFALNPDDGFDMDLPVVFDEHLTDCPEVFWSAEDESVSFVGCEAVGLAS